MREVSRCVGRAAAVVVIAALVSAFWVRLAPGALVDERELNQKLSETTLAQLRAERASRQSIGSTLVHYLRGLLHGDLGYSESNNAPVAALIRDRAPETIKELAIGLAAAWVAGFGFAITGARLRKAPIYDIASATITGFLLSLPIALIAYFAVATGTSAGLVMAVALTPRIFRFSRNLLRQAYGAHHIETARASGVSEIRIFASHVLPSTTPQLFALMAASVTMAIGAAIPIEAISDAPGLGRLAWQAALARDLPLLVNLTMLIALVTTTAMSAAEALTGAMGVE